MEGNLWLYRLYFRVVILLWLPVSLSAVDLPNLTFRTITIMSDYPMLISNKLHSFRNFKTQIYIKLFKCDSI